MKYLLLLPLLLTSCIHEYDWNAGKVYLETHPKLQHCSDFQTMAVKTQYNDETHIKTANYYVTLTCEGNPKRLLGHVSCQESETAQGKVWYYPDDLVCKVAE